MYHANQTENSQFDLFDLVTVGDIDLTRGHQMFRRVIRIVPDAIHAISSSLFHSKGYIAGKGNENK